MKNALPLICFLLLCVDQSFAGTGEAKNVPENQLACEREGGIWSKLGLLGSELCNKKTKDGGKECRSSSECESACIKRNFHVEQIGKSGSGVCYERILLLGTCLARVEKGEITAPLCLD